MIVFCTHLKLFLPVSTDPHGTDKTRNKGTEQQEDVCFGNVALQKQRQKHFIDCHGYSASVCKHKALLLGATVL